MVFQKFNSANGGFLNLNCGQLNHFVHMGVFGWNGGEETTWGEASLWTACN